MDYQHNIPIQLTWVKLWGFLLSVANGHRVSFHAHNLRDSQPKAGSPLIVEDIVINEGNCYSTSTGIFMAPFNGQCVCMFVSVCECVYVCV